MCHQDYPCKNRANQLVALLTIDVVIRPGNGKRIIKRNSGEIKVDAVFWAVSSIFVFMPDEQNVYT